MTYKIVECPRCKWIQITTAKRPKCRRCGYRGKGFKKYAELNESWKATIFIQKLKEYLAKKRQI